MDHTGSLTIVMIVLLRGDSEVFAGTLRREGGREGERQEVTMSSCSAVLSGYPGDHKARSRVVPGSSRGKAIKINWPRRHAAPLRVVTSLPF